MIYAAIIAAAAALIGAAIAAGDNAKAQSIRQGVADKYHDLPLPVLDKVVAQRLPPDAADRYMKSTQATDTQGAVLGKYKDEISQQGETAQDRASYLRMSNEAGGIANSTNAAVDRQMATRGLSGSGLSYSLQSQGAQNAANVANQIGIQEAADARGRYITALGAAGNMAGQMRGQELSGMASQDAINMFNARQQTEANRYNAGLSQQQYDNTKGKLDSEANALNGVAAGNDANATAARQTGAGIGQSAISVGAAYDQYGNPKKKDDYEQSAGA